MTSVRGASWPMRGSQRSNSTLCVSSPNAVAATGAAVGWMASLFMDVRSGAVLRIVSCASRHETQDSTNDAQILFYATTDKINPALTRGACVSTRHG